MREAEFEVAVGFEIGVGLMDEVGQGCTFTRYARKRNNPKLS